MTLPTAVDPATGIPAAQPFGARLRAAMDSLGPLCVGIDPHRGLVESWGLAYDVSGVETFARTCVEAFAGEVAVVKPQSAFFEVFGSRGVAVLERVLADLRSASTLTILDAKRGDIGSTMDAYAAAYVGPDAPSPGDALTVNPYLGYGALRSTVDLARSTGRGVFVLALTSNPEGASVQHATGPSGSVAASMVAGAAADNAEAAAEGRLGDVGLVVGATVGSALRDLDLDLVAADAPILAPGFGSQGADATDVAAVFGDAAPNVLANSSRGVLKHGPDVVALRAAARRDAEALATAFSR